MRGRESRHLRIENGIGRRIIRLPSIAEAACYAGEAARKFGPGGTGRNDGRKQRSPAVHLDAYHLVEHVVAFVRNEFGILHTGAVDNTGDRAAKRFTKRLKSAHVRDVHSVIGGMVS